MPVFFIISIKDHFADFWQRIWDKVYSPSQGELSRMSELELRDLGIGRSEIPRFQTRQPQHYNRADTALLRKNAPLIIPDDPATNK